MLDDIIYYISKSSKRKINKIGNEEEGKERKGKIKGKKAVL